MLRLSLSRGLLFSFALLALARSAPAFQCALETQELSAPDGQPGDGFGYRVERAGSVALVAATFDDDRGLDSGAVYVYERGPLTGWKLSKKLLASDGAAGDLFGYALAVDGSNVLVSSPLHDGIAARGGTIYVFSRDQGGPGNWGESARLRPPDLDTGAGFGYSMAVRGDRLLVGAPHHGLSVPGSAYLYRRAAARSSAWTLELEFTSTDPATALEFGQDVALGDTRLAVSGSRTSQIPYSDSYVVHLRERDAGGPDNWGEVQRISSPSGTRDFFGYEIALDGERLVAVAPGETNPVTSDVGALYLYGRDQGGPGRWGLERRIVAPSVAGGPFTAEEVDLRGDWLVAGCPAQSSGGLDSVGAIHVFGRNVGAAERWGEVARIQDSDPAPQAFFGLDLTLEGDELLIGAPGAYGSTASGDLYVLDLGRVARAEWRNDAGRINPDVHTALTRPQLGATYVAAVDLGASGHRRAVLAAFSERVELSLPGGRVLLGRHLLGWATRPGPLARFEFALPADPALCGLALTTQAGLLGGRPFALSNAQDLVLGMQ